MIDSLKSKYEKLDISSSDLMKLREFTFQRESTENLIEAIRQFEFNTSERGLLNGHTYFRQFSNK